MPFQSQKIRIHLSKSRRPRVSEDLLAGLLGDTVRQRELEVLGDELSDIRTTDVLLVVNLDNSDDLEGRQQR